MDIHQVKRIVIFGVEGFLGHQAFQYLKNNYLNWDIIGVSKQSHPYSKAIIDITDAQLLQTFIRTVRPDCILWYAGKSIPKFSESFPKEAYQINVQPLQDVMKVLENHVRFMFPSSRHVYAPSKTPTFEESPLLLQTNYAQFKYEAEQIVLQHPNSIVTRNFNCIGPNPVEGTFMHDILRQKNESIITLYNPDQVLDVMDYRIAIQAHRHLILHPNLNHRIFNVCSGVGLSIRELVSAILYGKKYSLQARSSEGTNPIVGDNNKLIESGFEIPRIDVDSLCTLVI